MSQTMDMFPIFDPVSLECLGHKQRDQVHTQGDWHRGVQANLVRPNDAGTFDILVQTRSNIVDIGGGKYDQSLATQMLAEDALDVLAALRRGLSCELGVEGYTYAQAADNIGIVKTYPEHPGALNRELISLYVVRPAEDNPPQAVSPKIAGLDWMEWGVFLRLFTASPARFTKTAQLYFSEPGILRSTEAASFAVAYDKPRDHLPDTEGILHIDRHPEAPQTWRGNLAALLSASGELALHGAASLHNNTIVRSHL